MFFFYYCKAQTHCCVSAKLFLCPSQSSQYVQCVAGCLQLMLKVNEYRFAWVEADGVNWWVMIACFHISDQMKSDQDLDWPFMWKASCKAVSAISYLVQNLFKGDSYWYHLIRVLWQHKKLLIKGWQTLFLEVVRSLWNYGAEVQFSHIPSSSTDLHTHYVKHTNRAVLPTRRRSLADLRQTCTSSSLSKGTLQHCKISVHSSTVRYQLLSWWRSQLPSGH